MAVFKVNVAEALSNDTFVGKMKQGVISKLVGRLPEVKIRGEQFFDLSGRTKGQLVGESGAKAETPTDMPLRHIRTTKLVYNQRFSDEFVKMADQEQLDIVNQLAQKWLQEDFLRDIDTVIIHGRDPLTGAVSTELQDYLLKPGSSVLVPSTGTTASAIDTDLATTMATIAEDGDLTGIAFSNSAAAKLAGIVAAGGQLKYPSLGRFGFNVDNFEGTPAASSKEVGDYNAVQLIAGDFDAIRYGLANTIRVELIEYGDPDNTGRDLKGHNEILLRAEANFGFGFANPNALKTVATPETDPEE